MKKQTESAAWAKRRWKRLLIAGSFALLLPRIAPAETKVLFIGNSFTIGAGGGGVPGIFDRLAQAGGHGDPTTVMRAEGGVDYEYHSQDATTRAAINSQPWTYVVMQNYSTEPTHLVDGVHSIADHLTYGTSLYQQILTNHPQTRVILFETWSRSAAHSLITGVSGLGSFASTAEFQAELRTNYHRLANQLNANNPSNPPVTVGPVGDAWENAGGLLPRSDPRFVDLHASDEYHGNDNGYYLAAAVFYSQIFGVSPRGLSSNALVSGLNLSLTVSPTLLEEVAWATVSGTTPTPAQAYLFDFGAATTPTTFGPAPNDPVNYWNNVGDMGVSPTGVLTNIVSTVNSSTAIGLAMVRRFNGVNEAGTTTSTLFPQNATRDSLFGNTEVFAGLSNIFPSFKLTGLDGAKTYSFTFYASRAGVGDNRETGYTVTGSNSGFVAFDPANNIDDISGTVSDITPNASGEIAISLAPTANNDNGNHFTYLGVLKVDVAPVQQPIIFNEEPVSQTVVELRSATFRASVQGTPPYFITWFSNTVPIPGASQFTYTLPITTTNMSGSLFSVAVSNLAYSATSSNAVLRVVPREVPVPAVQGFLIDFGGGNTTENGLAPDDPVNHWNNLTAGVGSSSTGQLLDLITIDNTPTDIDLVMLSRFNGANENGTLASPLFPSDATRDSLFGNTELFNNLTNIFPRFKLTGLSLGSTYTLTFYASRTGVGDNRTTRYTVAGASTNDVTLNAANNIIDAAVVAGVQPDATGEITISLAPAAANNNGNHFTYLGVLRVDASPAQFQLPVLSNGQVTLHWTGVGQLQWAPAINGPWTPVLPRPSTPYSEAVAPAENRFFRLNTSP